MYFCGNCGKVFETGKFSPEDSDIYEEVCPECGCYPPDSFWWWLLHLPGLLKIRREKRRWQKEWERLKGKEK